MKDSTWASKVPGAVNGGRRSARVEPAGGGALSNRASQSLARAWESWDTSVTGENSTAPAGECTTRLATMKSDSETGGAEWAIT